MTSGITALFVAALLLPGVCSTASAAESYPNRPIRFVVGNPAGGGQDILARAIGAKLSNAFSVPVVVDNRPGAAGNIGAEVVSRAAPDGYTLLMVGFANATNVGLFKQLPFDLMRDFASVALVAESTNFLVVPGSSRIASVRNLIADAKAAPGKLNYASGGNGTAPHLGSELFKRMAGVDIVHVPFKGGGQSIVSVIAGQVDMLIVNPLAGLPHIREGRLKALGVTSLKRSPAAPAIPTVAESGLVGYEVISWWGVLAPAKTPQGIVTRLHQSIGDALQQPDIKARFESQGIDVSTGTPAQFRVFLQNEIDKWTKVIRETGIDPI